VECVKLAVVKSQTFSSEVNNCPTRCNNNDLLISKISSTYFGQFFAHLQGRKTEIYSMWYSVLVL